LLIPQHNQSTILRTLDLACIVAGFLIAVYVVTCLSRLHLFFFPHNADFHIQYSTLLLLGLLSWTGVSTYRQIYHSRRAERLLYAAYTLLQNLILWGTITAAGVFFLKLDIVSRQFTLYFVSFAGCLLLLCQYAVMEVLRRLRHFGYGYRTAIVIGESPSCEEFATLLMTAYPMGYHVLTMPVENDDTAKLPRQGVEKDLPEADDAFIIGAIDGEYSINNPALQFLKRGASVHIVPGLFDARLFKQMLGEVAGVPVISLVSGRLSLIQSLVKRAVDLVGGVILIVLLSPLLALIAAAVKLTSGGPVLFAQKRLGKDGKPFMLYKFRTMHQNAEELLRASPQLSEKYRLNNFKLPKGEDPRVTRLGALLRSTSLDELPQLLNVIRGDMSLVGPRPVVPPEIEMYADYATLFLSAKPGMTGHWQVNGRGDLGEYAKRVELDLEYIRDQSVGKDLEILLRTVPAVLRRKGAY
jgi:exopolysaccharide production protein ExoY